MTPGLPWSLLRPRAIKLINNVSPENVEVTAQKFVDLGFPWAHSDSVSSLANLIVFASAGHGFYAECYGQLACVLAPRCESGTLASATDSAGCADFLSVVKAALSQEFQRILSAMSEDEKSKQTTPAAGKLRDRLVNSCKLAASLFHLSAYSVEDVWRVLQWLGVLNTVRIQQSLPVASTDNSIPEQQAPPRVAMLSGACPSTQPFRGESMSDWRDRLACELDFPSQRLGLLANESEVPLNACLDDFEGMLQVLVWNVYVKEEYRIEAASTLVLKAMPDLVASVSGQDLLRQVFVQWEHTEPDLSKRAQFMIMDVKSASAEQGFVH